VLCRFAAPRASAPRAVMLAPNGVLPSPINRHATVDASLVPSATISA